MSNQFYNYVAKKIFSFFENNSFEPGEKFLIKLDDNNQIDKLVDALKEFPSSPFRYPSVEGFDDFNTFCLDFDNKSLVVVGSDVESSYLVTLRNRISDWDEGELNNKALLIITSTLKDSIIEGSKNLQEKGFPLDINYLSNNLLYEINNSTKLRPYVKDILNVYLESLGKNTFYETSLWDFKEVLSILNKEKIDISDYKGLNLFYDSDLESITNSNTRKSRLKKNQKLFHDIRDIVNFWDFDKEIESMFDKKGIKEFSSHEYWHDSDFSILLESQNNLKDKKSKLKYEGIISKIDYWDIPDVNNGNVRNIIIFNRQHDKTISLTVKFDKKALSSFLNKTSKKQGASVSNGKLKFKISLDSNKPTFRRYTYHHENVKKNKYIFNVCVVDVPEINMQSINGKYQIKSNGEYILLDNSEDVFYFGQGNSSEVIINNGFGEFDVSENNSIEINVKDSLLNSENGEIDFSICFDNFKIPFRIEDESIKAPHLIDSFLVWNYKRIYKSSFLKEDNNLKLIYNDKLFNIRPELNLYLDLEEKIISNRVCYGCYHNGELKKIEIFLPDNLQEIYEKIFDYYSKINNVPSLVFIDDNLRELYEKLLDTFVNEIKSIESESDYLSYTSQRDLMKLGVIKCGERILFSPLSPLNIAYQLEVNNQCKDEVLNKEILDMLIPNDLLPYIENNGILYSPIVQREAYEWIQYKNSSVVSIGTTNIYLSRLVTDKLHDFVDNFKYLFDSKFKAPLNINIVNINDDSQIVEGVFKFVESYLPNNEPIPIEIHIYSNGKSKFDNLFECNDEKDLEDKCKIKLKSKSIDSLDILRTVQENINYYSHEIDDYDYNYSHISFYKPSSNKESSSAPMNEMETGLSLNGLISAVTSNNFEQGSSNNKNYRTGFGTKNVNLNCKLVRVSKCLNELAFNSRSGGNEVYSKNRSIVSMPDKNKDKVLNSLFEKSNWVTFIDPNFGLDYFSDEGIFIIHYSDQYSSSSKYDTITVTKKYDQYDYLIRRLLDAYLEENEFDRKKINIKDIIRIFNSVNGEWLLDMSSNDEKVKKEKLSMISGVKFALSLFDHEDIIWVPISMAEVLRVSGNLGLKQEGGLFSVKNLRNKRFGKYSDDLLLMGLNIKKLEVYVYPIEVKIGKNPNRGKAKKQVEGTYNYLKEFLSGDGSDSFDKKFYRNFFIQMFLSNCQKFIDNNIWDNKEFVKINNFKKILLNDEYELSWNLEPLIGIGAFICFQEGIISRRIIDGPVRIIELPESDGYSGVVYSIDYVGDLIVNLSKKLLKGKNLNILENVSKIKKEDVILGSELINKSTVEDSNNNIKTDVESSYSKEEPKKKPKKNKTQLSNHDDSKINITNEALLKFLKNSQGSLK